MPTIVPARARVSLWKRLSFGALNAGLCVAGASAWYFVFPDLPIEFSTVVPPLGVISMLVAAVLHEVVLRCSKHCARALALYGAFVATLILYGLFLGVTQVVMASSERGLSLYVEDVRIAVVFGHFFGLPVLVGMGLVNQCLSPVLCPRPAS